MTFSAKWRYNLKRIFCTFPRLLMLGLFLFLSPTALIAENYFPKDKWRIATPESQGMSSEILSDMIDLLWQKNHEIDSILIVRNGFVVLDTLCTFF